MKPWTIHLQIELQEILTTDTCFHTEDGYRFILNKHVKKGYQMAETILGSIKIKTISMNEALLSPQRL